MPDSAEYIAFFSEIIKRHILILGPQVVLSSVNKESSINITKDGEVKELREDPEKTLQLLISRLSTFSQETTKHILYSIIKDYPKLATSIKKYL